MALIPQPALIQAQPDPEPVVAPPAGIGWATGPAEPLDLPPVPPTSEWPAYVDSEERGRHQQRRPNEPLHVWERRCYENADYFHKEDAKVPAPVVDKATANREAQARWRERQSQATPELTAARADIKRQIKEAQEYLIPIRARYMLDSAELAKGNAYIKELRALLKAR